MSEEVKTITFLAVALVTGITAFVVSREAAERTAEQEVGKAFVEIDDALEVKRLKIVKFDEDTGQAEPFEVAQVGGLYSIPSHENYPADARDHLVEAVNFVNNVQILSSVGDSPGTHKDFGVLDPSSEGLGRGEEGVGTRVTMSSADGAPLADFVIGKEVKDAAGQRYVRHADKDQVFTVEIDPGKLSTRFEDWIERDLLKLDPMDVSKLAINDYAVETKQEVVFVPSGPRVANVVVGLDMKSSIDLDYDQKDFEWKLKQLVAFEEGQPKEQELGDDEELNTTTLGDLKSALDDLEIVDVRRKVEGLGSNLEKFIQENPDAIGDLERRGFYFQSVGGPGGQRQYILLSNNGEITVGLKTGVEYALRFGNLAGAEKKEDGDPAAAETEDADEPGDEPTDGDNDKTDDGSDDEEGGKALRYLFVLAQLNKDLIPKPELEEVPPKEPPVEEEKADEEETMTPDSQGAPGGADDNEGTNADVPGDDVAPTDGAQGEESESGEEGAVGTEEEAANESSDDSAGERTDEPADEGADDAGDEKSAEETEEDRAKRLEAWKERRAQIIKDNERKQKDYDKKIKEAEKSVKDLNERFAAWYYVINDETYRKIHLSRSDIIKTKEKTDDNGDGIGEPEKEKDSLETFEELQKGLPADGGE